MPQIWTRLDIEPRPRLKTSVVMQSLPLSQRVSSIRCKRCTWPFQVPIIQLHYRHFCRACETRQAKEIA